MIAAEAKRSVCVIGTGFVGLASIAGFAELGWDVAGYDVNRDRIRKLQLGIVPTRESGVAEALRAHLAGGRVAFFDSLERATSEADVIIVSVGTPARDDGSADLSALYDAVESLARLALGAWPTIVIRSTVPPGTSDRVAKLVEGWGELVYAPAFLNEGSALHDFLHPDRIVVGSDGAGAAVLYVKLLESLAAPLVFTSRASAELIERGANAFLALKTSFASEIANLCDAFSATSDDVLRGIGYDRRIGLDFLNPGLGLGKPGYENDVKSIECVAAKYDLARELLSATLRVNAAAPQRVVGLVEDAAGSLPGLTIGVWGLALASGADNLCDARVMRIINLLAERGASVVAYDPAVHVADLPKGSRLVPSALAACDADVLLVLTELGECQAISPQAYAPLIRLGVVIDCSNVLDAERVACAGLRYQGVGRALAGGPPSFTMASAL